MNPFILHLLKNLEQTEKITAPQGVCSKVEIQEMRNTDTAAREDLLTWARSRNWRSHLIKNLGDNFDLGRIVYCAEQVEGVILSQFYSLGYSSRDLLHA